VTFVIITAPIVATSICSAAICWLCAADCAVWLALTACSCSCTLACADAVLACICVTALKMACVVHGHVDQGECRSYHSAVGHATARREEGKGNGLA
jgi:hypothetical protein